MFGHATAGQQLAIVCLLSLPKLSRWTRSWCYTTDLQLHKWIDCTHRSHLTFSETKQLQPLKFFTSISIAFGQSENDFCCCYVDKIQEFWRYASWKPIIFSKKFFAAKHSLNLPLSVSQYTCTMRTQAFARRAWNFPKLCLFAVCFWSSEA